jgi:anti-sigma factor RsiW
MKLPAHDHPDLTAYALGELAPADAARVRNWLAQSPEAMAEFKRIQQTVEALQAAPALPKRALHPHQRETVLAMGQPTARPKNVVPFLGFRRPAGSGTRQNTAGRVVKYAAAACLVAGAFMLGQKTATRMTPAVASDDDASNPETFTARVAPLKPSPVVLPATVQVAVAKPQSHAPAGVAPVVDESKDKAPVAVASAPAPVAPVVVAEAKVKAPVAPVAAAAKTSPPAGTQNSGSGSLHGFAQASVSAEAELTVRPQSIRPRTLPVPHEFAGVVLASPLPPDGKLAPAPAQSKPEAQPALEIHTWKAEFASCPWDSNRRLMRLVVQLPVEQPGIESNDRDYTLVAKFDPFQVQGFRLVTEKQMRPTGLGTQATCFAWYEIIPTRNFNPSLEKPVTVGSVSIEQPRGATSNLAPLKLVDKGLAWKDAREDFVFETAMIGWNMLLNGTENIGGLNSKFVLDLAEQTRGEDARGERTKFINAVKQAQRAVGM